MVPRNMGSIFDLYINQKYCFTDFSQTCLMET
jgi:hypothetical protein